MQQQGEYTLFRLFLWSLILAVDYFTTFDLIIKLNMLKCLTCVLLWYCRYNDDSKIAEPIFAGPLPYLRLFSINDSSTTTTLLHFTLFITARVNYSCITLTQNNTRGNSFVIIMQGQTSLHRNLIRLYN